MNINDKYTVIITNYDHQGRGISRINDIIVFIPNTIIGEEVEIKITCIKKNFLEGEVVNFIKKSDIRENEICPYAGICGGCDIMHLPYSEQLRFKENKVKDIMRKYASLDCVNSIIGSDSQFYYRNKVTFQVNSIIGLYKKKSYEIIPVNKCCIVDRKINNYLELIRDNVDLSCINQVVIRTSKNDLMIIFYMNKNITVNTKCFDCNVLSCFNKKFTILKGKDYIIDEIGNLRFKISPTSFFQVNSNQVKKLYDKVSDGLDLTGNEKVLDLYCGTGTIGLYVSSKAKDIYGIEINKEAIEDAKYNAEMNGIFNATFESGDSGKLLSSIKFKPDYVIVDPPRSGLDDKVINYLNLNKFEKIVYVSCDPITLARDLKLLSEKYLVKEITPVDMFSNTYHVECVSVLFKKN